MIKREKPFFVILSPMCKAFSLLQGLNRARMGEAKWAAMLKLARVHLSFAMEIAEMQIEDG